MPDKYGRFNLQDGLNIARSMRTMRRANLEEQVFEEQLEKDKQTAEAAKLLKTGGNISEFPADVQNRATQIHNEGMRLNKEKAKLGREELNNAATLWSHFKKKGNMQQAYEAVLPFYNEHIPDGAKIEGVDAKKGTMEISRLTPGGRTRLEDSLPTEKEVEIYFKKASPEYLARSIKVNTARQAKNAELFQSGEQVWDKDGNIAYKFFRMDDKGDSEMMITNPTTDEVYDGFDPKLGETRESGKKWMTMEERVKEALGKKYTAQEALAVAKMRAAKHEQDKNKLELEGKKLTNYNKKLEGFSKELDLLLRTFSGNSGMTAILPGEEGELSRAGKTQLSAAIKLVNKEKDPRATLTPEEQRKLPYAQKALEAYEKIIDTIDDRYAPKKPTKAGDEGGSQENKTSPEQAEAIRQAKEELEGKINPDTGEVYTKAEIVKKALSEKQEQKPKKDKTTDKKTPEKLPQTFEELKQMTPEESYVGPYKRTPDYESITSIWEWFNDLSNKNIKLLPELANKKPLDGEDKVTFALRVKGIANKLNKQNNIKKQLQAVLPEMSEEEMAENILRGRLLGGQTPVRKPSDRQKMVAGV